MAATKADLTAARLRTILSYEPASGVFRWLAVKCKAVGTIAGCAHKTKGYWFIEIDGRRYRASRLAWLYMTGEWPKNLVDHENRDRADTRWSNLRNADKSQNGANMAMRAGNRSGFKGVRRDKKRFSARITVQRREIHLGNFDTPEEAHAAYVAAAREHFGEFARAA